jgi:peroxiredoxin
LLVSFGFSATYIALWAMVILQGLLILALLQRLEKLRELLERGSFAKDRLPLGSNAPEFFGTSQFGRQTGLRSLDGRGGVILFLSPDCPLCNTLAGSIGALVNELAPTIAVCRGVAEACAVFSKQLGNAVEFLADPSGETAALYGVSAFPTAVIIDGSRKIRGYGHPKGVEELKRTFAESLAEHPDAAAVPEVSLTSSNSA